MTYWLISCDEPHSNTRLSGSYGGGNLLYPLIRNSPSNNRRRVNQHTGTPQSHRGSPVALASRFDRTSSLRGSRHSHNQANGVCLTELEPLMSDI